MAVSPKSLENLKKGPRFTSETAREAGKRGKRKSDEVKKHKKDMAQLLSVIAEGDIADQEVKDSLAALGFEDEDMQNEALVKNARPVISAPLRSGLTCAVSSRMPSPMPRLPISRPWPWYG